MSLYEFLLKECVEIALYVPHTYIRKVVFINGVSKMQLITRSSNKTLYLALVIALGVHFIISLFARFDYIEPAINILTSPPPLSITLQKTTQPVPQVAAEIIKTDTEAQRTQPTKTQQAVGETRQRDYLANENWQLGHNFDTNKLIVNFFEPKVDKTLYLELGAKAFAELVPCSAPETLA